MVWILKQQKPKIVARCLELMSLLDFHERSLSSHAGPIPKVYAQGQHYLSKNRRVIYIYVILSFHLILLGLLKQQNKEFNLLNP